MPVERQKVEADLAEQERIAREEEAKFLAGVDPYKAKVLETMTNDPEHLYSGNELMELFWTIPPPLPEPLEGETREAYDARLGTLPQLEPKDAEHPLITEEGAQLLNAAVHMLVEQDKKVVVYRYEGQFYFGIAKEEPLKVKACACDGS